jgi:hypothetical protein
LDRRPPVPDLTVQRPGQAPERRELLGPLRAGGSHADDVHLPSCPPGALWLVPCAAGVVAEAASSGVRAAGRTLAPGDRRLLRSGERVELHGATIAVDPPAADATRAGAGALLRGAAAGAAPLAGAHLVVLTGRTAGTRHPLGGEQTIGRGRAASIVVPDPHASRVHARLRIGAAGAVIEDLGSKNGVRVNGVRIDRRPCPLRPGDEVRIGETALGLVDHPLAPADARQKRASPRRRPPAHVLAAALLALSAAALALAAR